MESNREGYCPPCQFVYMNNLSLSLNRSGIGGSLGDNIICNLCYADDLCLISLSSSGMQHVLDICDTYAINYHITQLNRFHCVLDQNRLKSTHLVLYWEYILFQLLINVNIWVL